MTDLTTSRYTVPDSVLQSQRAREHARSTTRPCSGHAGRCQQPAQHSCAAVGGMWCDDCWAALGIRQPTPDPARTADAMQKRQAQSIRAAELLRDIALDGVHERSDEWAPRAVHDAISKVAALGQPFSANDVRPLLPPGIPGPLLGACFRRAATAGLIRKTDRRVPSSEPSTHAHEIAVWDPM